MCLALPLQTRKVDGVAASTNAVDVVALAYLISLEITLMVYVECFSSEGLIVYSTLVLLEFSYLLSKIGVVPLGSLFLEISFFSLFCIFGAIIHSSKQFCLHFEL